MIHQYCLTNELELNDIKIVLTKSKKIENYQSKEDGVTIGGLVLRGALLDTKNFHLLDQKPRELE